MDTPILFLVFNRPDTTEQVFNAIRQAKPKRLYVVADGPRVNNKNDLINCLAVREIVKNIDWQCQLNTVFREQNLGCKDSIVGGINWFFDNEESGIILEDDCLPTANFFNFCQLMLENYKDEKSIFTISGINTFGQNVTSSEYYFSKYQSIWGWATWRDRWRIYELSIKNRLSLRQLKSNKYYPWHFAVHIDFCLSLVEAELLNTWDYQLQYALAKVNGFCLRPHANLISNIGPDGVHSYGNSHNIYHAFGIIDMENIVIKNKIKYDARYDKKIWNMYANKFKIEIIRIILFKLGLYKVTKKIVDIIRK